MPDVQDPPSTPLDALSRDVPDSALGPVASEEEKKAQRLALVHKALRAIGDINDKLGMIERALGSCLPEVLREEALGDAVDIVSDLKVAIDILGTEDGGAVSALRARLKFAREVVMPEVLDAAKVKTFNTDRFRVTKTTRVMASVNKEAGFHTEGEYAGQPVAWDWLRENGYDALIKPTVNASSLSAAAKEVMENGMEMPEELFNVHTQPSISVTKKGS